MRTLSALVALALVLGLAGRALAYTMEDLEALEKQQSWAELVQHLGDIAPSKRDSKWQRVAEHGVVAYLGTLPIDELHPLEPLQAADRLAAAYPFLRSSGAFMAKRNEVGLKGFQACYGSRCRDNERSWRERLLKFAQSDAGNRRLQMDAGKLLMRYLIAELATPFFHAALTGTHGSADCKDPAVAKAVTEALAASDYLDDARDIASNLCWNELRPALSERLDKATQKDDYFKNACPLLKAKNALTPAQVTACAPPPQ